MLQHLRNLWTCGATFTDTRGGSRGSKGARERGSGSCENAADQGAQGTRRVRVRGRDMGKGRVRGRGRKRSRAELEEWESEISSELSDDEMKREE